MDMDVEGDSDGDVKDLHSGEEPGAASEHFLIADDADDDLSDAGEQKGVPRRRSGTISRLKKEIKKQQLRASQVEVVKATNANWSSDDAGNSSNMSGSESDYGAVPDVDANTDSEPVVTSNLLTDTNAERDHELEYIQSLEWKNQAKHVFVLSQSGKPIYSRYGNEEKLVTTFGVMQALVSFITHSEEKDTLKCITSEDRKFVFLVKEHLILVVVSSLNECNRHLQLQLQYVYNQILSVLTLSQLNKIYQQRVNYDLRRMLGGTEKFLDKILSAMEEDPSYLLGSVRCLPLNPTIRDTVTQAITQNCKVKDLVFAIIISDNQLVSLVRMKKFSLHPQDIHIILNMVNASDSFKTAETWLPICLPKFDNSGFLHTYISYLDHLCNTCLIMMTVDSEQFPVLSECKSRIVERLNRTSCLQAIAESASTQGYTIDQVGVPELRHFIYKSRSTAQFTCPKLTAPYVTPRQRQRLQSRYMSVHGRMHSHERPLRILYESVQYESILGWLTDGFELYAVFSPLITKSAAIQCINKILKWIKKEESRLFISSQTTF